MSLVSIAFVDRNDELLFAKEFASRSYGSIDFEQKEEGHSIISTSAFQCSLRHQFLLQSGLENMNQMLGKGSDTWREPGAQGTDAMFVGLLSLEDEFRLYGTYIPIYVLFSFLLSLIQLQTNISPQTLCLVVTYIYI